MALECPSLEKLSVKANISITTFKLIVHYCTKIRHLAVERIIGFESVDDARSLVESLTIMENRELLLDIYDFDNKKHWVTDDITEMLSNLGLSMEPELRSGPPLKY